MWNAEGRKTMQIDIWQLSVDYHNWQENIDNITGEMRGELLAWAILNGHDELVSEAICCNCDDEGKHKSSGQSWRRDAAEWFMNMFSDNRTHDAWTLQTQAMHWNYAKFAIHEHLLLEEEAYRRQMSYRCDITAYKEALNAGLY